MTDKNPKVYLLFSVCACLNKALQMVSAMVAAAPLPELYFCQDRAEQEHGEHCSRDRAETGEVYGDKGLRERKSGQNGYRDCRCKRCNDHVHIKHTQVTRTANPINTAI